MSQIKSVQDKLLTNVSSGYKPEGFLCESILPVVKHAQYTGKLGSYGTQHLRIETSITGGQGKYRRVEAKTVSTSSFSISGHGLEGIVTKMDYANFENPFDAESDEIMGLSTKLWLEKEYALASTLSNVAVMTKYTTLAGNSRYSNYLESDPIDDFNTARASIVNNSGAIPNLAIMDWLVWNTLRFHPQMLDNLGFKDNRPGGLNESELALAMGVKKVLVALPRYESAAKGQDSSLAPVWGKNIIFAACPDSAQKFQISLGYMIRKTGSEPRKVYKYAIDNPPESTGVLVEDEYDMLISNAGAGYLIKDAIA